jgi:hypothetical protein
MRRSRRLRVAAGALYRRSLQVDDREVRIGVKQQMNRRMRGRGLAKVRKSVCWEEVAKWWWVLSDGIQ